MKLMTRRIVAILLAATLSACSNTSSRSVASSKQWPVGLPTVEAAQNQPPNMRGIYILQSARFLHTLTRVDDTLLAQGNNAARPELNGSYAYHFQIGDLTKIGTFAVDIPADELVALKLIPVDGSDVIGGMEVTTIYGVQIVPAPDFYEVEPSDGNLNQIAALLHIDPDHLAAQNPTVDRTRHLDSGTHINLIDAH